MYRLSSIIGFITLATGLMAQSPHGDNFKINCAACHTADSWDIPFETWDLRQPVSPKTADEPNATTGPSTERFTHDETAFPLLGVHASTDCRLCHESLRFSEANTECISCHTDLHRMTVGSDCMRCHTFDNWLVDNITELHQENGFPLLGIHAQIGCTDCHVSESGLQFNRLGNDCFNCHLQDYMATTSPSHTEAGYSTDCIDCHDVNAFDWGGNVLHDFFPLVKGHDIADCNQCHTNPTYSNTPSDCFACHQMDFEATMSPNHNALNFNTDCAACHTLDFDWMPAEFRQHDSEFFPIYSGSHRGEWSACMECHPNPADYGIFTCTTCHGESETTGDHNGIGGYVYESTACLACHPTGDEDGTFDHNQTDFPLTGAHTSIDCNSCHANGFAGTPTDCAACHTVDFQQTTSPDHEAAGFPMDCAACHTTAPNWMPATFDHDGMYFPIYSGEHRNEWNDCIECHTTPGNYALFSCIDCHEHNDQNDLADEHDEVSGYSFSSPACFSCHPNGE